jgi:hypothetical protein
MAIKQYRCPMQKHQAQVYIISTLKDTVFKRLLNRSHILKPKWTITTDIFVYFDSIS